VENELNKKTRFSGSGQNALEKMRDRKQPNKGFKNYYCKNLESKARIIEIKLSCSARGRKEATIESNKREFNNESKPLPDALLDYLNSIEILNRQSLPLRSNYSRKVQEYFNKNDQFNTKEFNLENEDAIANWLSASILSEGRKREINYIFCDDEYSTQNQS
jgi:hypothetical protein